MQTWHMVVIVIIVFAIIIGNLALLKHSANLPFKKTKPDKTNSTDTKKPWISGLFTANFYNQLTN